MNRHSPANIGRVGMIVMPDPFDPVGRFLHTHVERCGLQAFAFGEFPIVFYELRRAVRMGGGFATILIDATCLTADAEMVRNIQAEFPQIKFAAYGDEQNLTQAEKFGIKHTLQLPLLSLHRETRVRELLNTLFPGD